MEHYKWGDNNKANGDEEMRMPGNYLGNGRSFIHSLILPGNFEVLEEPEVKLEVVGGQLNI